MIAYNVVFLLIGNWETVVRCEDKGIMKYPQS